jgi:DNA-binding Xre family transcriptional regulator
VLADKGTTITKVHTATGISRNTLTMMATNTAKMVQYVTLDKLAQHLGVTPADIIEYAPYTMDMSVIFDPDAPANDDREVRNGDILWKIDATITVKSDDKTVDSITYTGTIEWSDNENPEEALVVKLAIRPDNTSLAVQYFGQLSTDFADDVKQRLIEDVANSACRELEDSQLHVIPHEVYTIIEFVPGSKADSTVAIAN